MDVNEASGMVCEYAKCRLMRLWMRQKKRLLRRASFGTTGYNRPEDKAAVSVVEGGEYMVNFDADGRTAHRTVEYPWKSVKNETTATMGSVRGDPWCSAQTQSVKAKPFGGLSRVETGR